MEAITKMMALNEYNLKIKLLQKVNCSAFFNANPFIIEHLPCLLIKFYSEKM